jgi:hypothetical protein
MKQMENGEIQVFFTVELASSHLQGAQARTIQVVNGLEQETAV